MNRGQNKGLTLVALVITIIVLLILTAVALRILFTGGVADKTQETMELYENKQVAEKQEISNHTGEFEEIYSELTGLGDGRWNGEMHPPKLGSGMVAIYWDESGNEITQNMPNFDTSKWYNYNESKWANAKTEEGSYWVWIPRYEYKIDSSGIGGDTSKAGIVHIRFISTATKSGTVGYATSANGITTSSDGYIIHPIFTNNVEQGGWDREISGMWVAKFEMARETSSNSGVTWVSASPNSDTVTVSEGQSRSRAVSKPRSKKLEKYKSK